MSGLAVGPRNVAVWLRKRWAWVLLGVVVVVIVTIVFIPGPPAESRQRQLRHALAVAHQSGHLRWLTFGLVEFTSNVVMFLPLGFLATLVLRTRRWSVVPACCALSAVIEIVQSVALPARDGTWQDVLANTVGGAIGFGLAILVRRR